MKAQPPYCDGMTGGGGDELLRLVGVDERRSERSDAAKNRAKVLAPRNDCLPTTTRAG